jgi:GDP-4-dehydro-6-deoxy-D-mannose reductase
LKVLVTGGLGFLGTYLAVHLQEQGAEVTISDLPSASSVPPATDAGLPFQPLDVRDTAAVDRVLDELRPDVVYHFAGLAYVIPSWNDPEGTFSTNVLGTLHLLESIRRRRPATRFAFAGSGTEYGDPDQIPTPETAPLKPTSPYASSKAAADLLCYQYFRSFEIPVVRYRIFGTTGPGKRGDSVNDFASQVAALEAQEAPRILRVGNLEPARDVTDVRDAVRAMALVAEKGDAGEAYNIGSGIPRKVRSTLETLLSLSKSPIEVQVDPARVRLVDEPVHLADIGRIRRLGWTPQIPFEQTLRDTLDVWRGRS